ncbi:hypothetical protein [Streptomyces sp. NPDC058424]|uniref:hypothetical protein n=1 Tax=Streptomyces sp. NPDC058424 TaxID=3346491 RepID=UPI00365B6932
MTRSAGSKPFAGLRLYVPDDTPLFDDPEEIAALPVRRPGRAAPGRHHPPGGLYHPGSAGASA